MFAATQLMEEEVRQAVLGCIQATLAGPCHSYSPEFIVADSLLSDLVCTTSTQQDSSSTNSDGDADSSLHSDSTADGEQQVFLTASVAELLERYHEATAADAGSLTAHQRTDAAQTGSSRHGKASSSQKGGSRSSGGTSSRSSSSSRRGSGEAGSEGPGDAAGSIAAELVPLVADLAFDHFSQVEPEDVSALCCRLLAELHSLAQAAAAAEAAAAAGPEGACALCGRVMPLTKHHLIPRDVHKEFRTKRGYSFSQLQEGLMVCRPCHSAIHRSVPDNRQLALHYSSLEALQQHEGVAKFAAWASRQRVPGRADVTAAHFKYRR